MRQYPRTCAKKSSEDAPHFAFLGPRLSRRNVMYWCLLLVWLASSGMAQAASVTLVKDESRANAGTAEFGDNQPVILTFGDERLIIHDENLPVAGERLNSRDVSLSDLFILRDRRPMAERIGYDTVYSHAGFQLAIVKEPEQLALFEHITLQPITGSLVVTENPVLGKADPDPAVEIVLNLLDPSYYEHYMSMLSKELPTRYSCADGQPTARDLIRQHFENVGLATDTMQFKNICKYSCRNQAGFDVIGVKEGMLRPQELYLVGAHYDSISRNPCQHAPGANDNASGMAGVMELARVFSQFDTEASLIFVAFSGEERGFWAAGNMYGNWSVLEWTRISRASL